MTSFFQCYGVAILSTAFVLGLKTLSPQLGETVPFLLCYVNVIVSTWYGGFRCGIFATVLTAVAADAFFMEKHQLLSMVIYVAEAAVVAYIVHRMRFVGSLAEKNHQFCKGLVNSVKDYAIFTIDKTGVVTSWNESGERILGYKSEEVIGKNFSMLFETLAMSAAEMVLAQRTGVAVDESWLIRKNGERFFAQNSLSPIVENGAIVGYTKVLKDITERKRLTDALEESGRLKDEFLAMLSHELRTPLMAILGWAKMVSDSRMPEHQRSRGFAIIERNAKVQAKLIEDLLDVSRIVSGKMAMSFMKTDLAKTINAAVETVLPTAQAKEIKVSVLLPKESRSVIGDPDRLQQVIWNLLTNAIKFTPKGGAVDVMLEYDEERNEATVKVADTGKGIEKDFLPFIFDRFRQADNSATRFISGLGLGLAIARHLVELHAGKIHAASAGENKGSVFKIVLPLTQGRPAASSAILGKVTDAPETGLAGTTVLIVEDDSDARDLIEIILAKAGANLICVENAVDAVVAYKRETPNVIVSDIGMPGEDGYSLMKKIRQFEKDSGKKHVKALALTSYAKTTDRLRALEAGYDEHVSKPIEPAALTAAVIKLL